MNFNHQAFLAGLRKGAMDEGMMTLPLGPMAPAKSSLVDAAYRLRDSSAKAIEEASPEVDKSWHKGVDLASATVDNFGRELFGGDKGYNSFTNQISGKLNALTAQGTNAMANARQFVPQLPLPPISEVSTRLFSPENLKKMPNIVTSSIIARDVANPSLAALGNVEQHVNDARHQIFPYTAALDQLDDRFKQFIKDQTLEGMPPEYKALRSGFKKEEDFANLPLWKKVTGLHNSRPDLNEAEFNSMSDMINAPGLGTAMLKTVAQNPSQVGMIAKDVANGLNTGEALRGVGLTSSLLSKLPLPALAPLAVAGGALRTVGNPVLLAGVAGNLGDELGRFEGTRQGSGQSFSQAWSDYTNDIERRNNRGTDDDEFLGPNWMHKYQNNQNRLIGSTGTALRLLNDRALLLQDREQQDLKTEVLENKLREAQISSSIRKAFGNFDSSKYNYNPVKYPN